MDIDRYVIRNSTMWARLAELTARARPRAKQGLAATETDELVSLYQRTSAQLAHSRTYFSDEGLNAHLTTLVADAHAVIHGAPPVRGTFSAAADFFSTAFPREVWACRRFIAASAALLFVPALALGAWLATSPEALRVAMPAEQQRALLDSEFRDYYSSRPAAEFSSQVLTNNIQVSFLAFALGIGFCVPTALLLLFNGANLGAAGGLFVHSGQGGEFFGLILPHGLLELTSIVIAGAAGLRLGWALIAPGDRTRGEALADAGRRSVTIVLGLMACFVVAGIIEGFVTPSGLPTLARVLVGVMTEVAFIAWILGRGRGAGTGIAGDAGTDW